MNCIYNILAYIIYENIYLDLRLIFLLCDIYSHSSESGITHEVIKAIIWVNIAEKWQQLNLLHVFFKSRLHNIFN